MLRGINDIYSVFVPFYSHKILDAVPVGKKLTLLSPGCSFVNILDESHETQDSNTTVAQHFGSRSGRGYRRLLWGVLPKSDYWNRADQVNEGIYVYIHRWMYRLPSFLCGGGHPKIACSTACAVWLPAFKLPMHVICCTCPAQEASPRIRSYSDNRPIKRSSELGLPWASLFGVCTVRLASSEQLIYVFVQHFARLQSAAKDASPCLT